MGLYRVRDAFAVVAIHLPCSLPSERREWTSEALSAGGNDAEEEGSVMRLCFHLPESLSRLNR